VSCDSPIRRSLCGDELADQFCTQGCGLAALKIWISAGFGVPKIKLIRRHLYIHECMGTKTPSIRTETYEMLNKKKRESESFSDEIDRLLKQEKTDLADYFGAIKDEDLLRGLEEDSRKIRGSGHQKS
jgi:predicted CopG family antitoxin